MAEFLKQRTHTKNMQAFTDFKNERWDVVISVDTVRRVRRALDIDILQAEPFLKQLQDIVTLCDILFLVCEQEAKERGIDSEEFGRRLLGPALREARDALMEAYINFTPDPAGAEKLRLIADRYAVVGEKMMATLEKKMPRIMEKIDEEVDATARALEKDIERELNKKPTSTN